MIVFDLVCSSNHRFEGWFTNRADFDAQQVQGMLTCPVCGAGHIRRLPSASRLNLNRHAGQQTAPMVSDNAQAGADDKPASELLGKLRSYILRHFEDVGNGFAEEVKKIHYGESEARNIRGQATAQEVGALLEEGIEAVPIPAGLVKDKQKLN